MSSDWTSPARNAVRYGYVFAPGDAQSCTNDAYSIGLASLDGLAQMGASLATPTPNMGAPYLRALAGVLRASRDPRNAAFAGACEAAADNNGPITPAVLRCVVWSAYYFQGDAGAVGVGSPEQVVLPEDTVAPAFGGELARSSNGAWNDSVCAPATDIGPPGRVSGWSPSPWLLFGMFVVGAAVVGGINARTPRLKGKSR